MKKWICVLLVAALLAAGLAAFAAAEDSDTVSFEPAQANRLDRAAEAWFSTAGDRALLTALLLADAGGGIDADAVVRNGTYVGMNEDALVVLGWTEGRLVAVFYAPENGTALYGFAEVNVSTEEEFDEIAKAVFPDNCPRGYHRNDPGAVSKCLDGAARPAPGGD